MNVIGSASLGDTVNFEVHPKGILPSLYQGCKLVSVLDFDSAKQIIDPIALHMQVYPYLPQGSAPNNPRDYHYVKVVLSNGNVDCLGIPWIDSATVSVVDFSTLRVTIEDVSPDKIADIRRILTGNGYNVTLVDVL